MRYSKYRNIKTVVDGIVFASKKEARKYSELKLLFNAGEIVELERQVPYPLEVNGYPICTYKADFVIMDKYGKESVIDVKGRKIQPYQIKKKLMFAIYGINIEEC